MVALSFATLWDLVHQQRKKCFDFCGKNQQKILNAGLTTSIAWQGPNSIKLSLALNDMVRMTGSAKSWSPVHTHAQSGSLLIPLINRMSTVACLRPHQASIKCALWSPILHCNFAHSISNVVLNFVLHSLDFMLCTYSFAFINSHLIITNSSNSENLSRSAS